jgi:hypothetical protein
MISKRYSLFKVPRRAATRPLNHTSYILDPFSRNVKEKVGTRVPNQSKERRAPEGATTRNGEDRRSVIRDDGHGLCGEMDTGAIIALARHCRASHSHCADLPYRLSSWALDNPSNAHLWLDAAGRLIAWAVLQAPFWSIDYAIDPDAGRELHPKVLMWAEERARWRCSTR